MKPRVARFVCTASPPTCQDLRPTSDLCPETMGHLETAIPLTPGPSVVGQTDVSGLILCSSGFFCVDFDYFECCPFNVPRGRMPCSPRLRPGPDAMSLPSSVAFLPRTLSVLTCQVAVNLLHVRTEGVNSAHCSACRLAPEALVLC